MANVPGGTDVPRATPLPEWLQLSGSQDGFWAGRKWTTLLPEWMQQDEKAITFVTTAIVAIALGVVLGPVMRKTLYAVTAWFFLQATRVMKAPYKLTGCLCKLCRRGKKEGAAGQHRETQQMNEGHSNTLRQQIEAFWTDVRDSLKCMTSLVTDLWKETSRSCGELKIAQQQAVQTLKDSFQEMTKLVEKAVENVTRHVDKLQFPSPTAINNLLEQSRTVLLQQLATTMDETSAALQNVMVGHQRQAAQNFDRVKQEIVQRTRELETMEKQLDQHARRQFETLKEIQDSMMKMQETLDGHNHVLAKLEDMTGKQEVAMARFAEAIDRSRQMAEDVSTDTERILAALDAIQERMGPPVPYRQPPVTRPGPSTQANPAFDHGNAGMTGVRPIQLAHAIPMQTPGGAVQAHNPRGEILRVVLDHLTSPNSGGP
ncbi:unnamed protein product [Symbiodinium natans]|uniref:Uncharacterized protein n=1 Tax=Symbiodinium natans TaxID=878477 RepID=A0A812PZB9_9DINO|nr:unnamed protein product [Symbiodinium natans]